MEEFQNENVQRKTHQKMTDLYLPYREENFWINLFLESTLLNLWNKCWSSMRNWFRSHAKLWWSRVFSLLYLLQLGKLAFIEVLGRVGREWWSEKSRQQDWGIMQVLTEQCLSAWRRVTWREGWALSAGAVRAQTPQAHCPNPDQHQHQRTEVG